MSARWAASRQASHSIFALIGLSAREPLTVPGNKVNEANGATAATEVSWVHVYGRSGDQAHDCAEGSGAVQAADSGSYATGKKRQHHVDDRRTGSVHAGLAQLFRLL
jgi:hypothetical protein